MKQSGYYMGREVVIRGDAVRTGWCIGVMDGKEYIFWRDQIKEAPWGETAIGT